MQDSTSSNSQVNTDDSSIELEKLLTKPQKKSEEWQTNASRLTAIEHNKSLRAEAEDLEYIRSLALCKWAQVAGVKDAKKKSLQATRYRAQIPPTLEGLKNPKLMNAAIDLMLNLRGPWCLDYISSQVVQPYIDIKGVPLLVTWAQKASLSPAEFLKTILNNCSNSEIDEKRILLLIKESSSKLAFSLELTSESAALQAMEAVQFTIDKLAEIKSEKVKSELSNLFKKIIEKISTSHPSVVVHAHFLQSLFLISQVPELRKIAQTIAAKHIGSSLKVLEDLCTLGGDDGISYGKLLIPALQKAYPNFDKYLTEFAKTSPILLNIKDKNTSSNEINLEDSATSIYARLLPAWNDFYTSQADQGSLSLINADLEAAAKLNGIEFLGRTGEVVAFDPVSQRLQDESGSVPTNVRIVRPAVIFRRANGTYRIILPAIVDFS
jgi:hypothetical protein